MALLSLPNPVKSTTVNFPIAKLDEAVRHISVVDKKFKLVNSNPAFNQYTYEASEFLSLGAQVVIDLNEITSEKTEIKLEVRRIIGTFDQPHEVALASGHIDKLFAVIAKIATGDINQLIDERTTLDINSKWHNRFGWMLFWAVLFFPVALFGLFKSTMSNTNKIIIGAIICVMLYFAFK